MIKLGIIFPHLSYRIELSLAGVFNTTLSKEFFHIAKSFKLDKEQLIAISTNAIEFIFDTEAKPLVSKMFSDFKYMD